MSKATSTMSPSFQTLPLDHGVQTLAEIALEPDVRQ